ncbi:DNA topoisomerase, partial [Thermococci archaeon]
MMKKHSAPEIKKETLYLIESFAIEILKQIEKGQFPTIELPARTTGNIVYDQRLRQYVLGNKVIRRRASNVKHLRPLTQLTWVAYIASMLIKEGKSSTLRDVFYMASGSDVPFSSQDESDRIITELESILKHPREHF